MDGFGDTGFRAGAFSVFTVYRSAHSEVAAAPSITRRDETHQKTRDAGERSNVPPSPADPNAAIQLGSDPDDAIDL